MKPTPVVKIAGLAIMLTTASLACAQAREWSDYGEAQDGTKYQTRDVKRSRETVQLWLKSILPSSAACKGNPFARSAFQQIECDASKAAASETVDRVEINCGTWQNRFTGGASYNSSGGVLRSLPGTQWTLILPDSIADGLATKFCSNALPKHDK